MRDKVADTHQQNSYFSSEMNKILVSASLLIITALIVTILPSTLEANVVGEKEGIHALSVQWDLLGTPASIPLDELFGQNYIARDKSGKLYLPELGINQINQWTKGEALYVHSLTGQTVPRPQASYANEFLVHAGWNYISPPTIIAALVTLPNDLIIVSQGEVVFREGTFRNDFTSFQAGEGYAVYSPTEQIIRFSSEENTLVVETIDDMISLLSIQEGDIIQVTDELRGGTFQVTKENIPCSSDGSTCFIPKNITQQATRSGVSSSVTLQPHLVFGSVILHAGNGNSLPDLLLHGHRKRSGSEPVLVDHKSGRYTEGTGLQRYANTFGNGRFTIDYEYATSNLRFEREIPQITGIGTDYYRPEWWGARPNDPNANSIDSIAWAVNKAHEKYLETGRIWEVRFDGLYYYAGVLSHKEGVRLKGENEGIRDGQGMKVMADVTKQRFTYRLDESSPYYVPPQERDPHYWTQDEWFVAVKPSDGAEYVEVKDFELDGNAQQNGWEWEHQDLFSCGCTNYRNQVESEYQNTPYHNAYAGTSYFHQDQSIQYVKLTNVHFHNYHGNVLLGWTNNMRFDNSSGIKVGNSTKNHQFYEVVATGTNPMRDVEIYGYGWGTTIASYGGYFEDIVFRPSDNNPWNYQLTDIINRRNPNGGVSGGYGGPMIINNFLVDATDYAHSNSRRMTNVEGSMFYLLNGEVFAPGERYGIPYWSVLSANNEHNDIRMENVTIHRQGDYRVNLINNNGGMVVRNVSIVDSPGAQPRDDATLFVLSQLSHRAPSPIRYYIDNVKWTDSTMRLKRFFSALERDAEAPPAYFYVKNVDTGNDDFIIAHVQEGDAGATIRGADPTLVTFFWENVQMNPNMPSWLIYKSLFRNYTDESDDKASEDTGSYLISAQGGETVLNVPTKLFWDWKQTQGGYCTVTAIGSPELVGEVTATSTQNPDLQINLTRPLTAEENVMIKKDCGLTDDATWQERGGNWKPSPISLP